MALESHLLLAVGGVNGIIGTGELLQDLPDTNYLLADNSGAKSKTCFVG
jgi:hypothetical protein